MNHQPEQDKPAPSGLNLPEYADLSRPVERRVDEFFRPVNRIILDRISGALLLVIAKVAGVLAALAIPARPRLHPGWFAKRLRHAAKELEDIKNPEIFCSKVKKNIISSNRSISRPGRS